MEKRILAVDDDEDILNIYRIYFKNKGYVIETALCGADGLQKVKTFNPDLIVLDVMMPQMNGYDFCSHLNKEHRGSPIPVIFATAIGDEKDKARAFALGAVDYLVKPFDHDELLAKIEKHLGTKQRWKYIEHTVGIPIQPDAGASIRDFVSFFADKIKRPSLLNEKIDESNPYVLWDLAEKTGFSQIQLVRYISEFSNLPSIPFIDPESIVLGVLPVSFSKKNKVVVVKNVAGENEFVVSNPFSQELLALLRTIADYKLVVTEIENIDQITGDTTKELIRDADFVEATIAKDPEQEHSGSKLANLLVAKGIKQRASDIHIEPKEKEVSVRFRVDGDMQLSFIMNSKTGTTIIARFKVLAGMDISERRKPQDGAFQLLYNGKKYKFRVATTSTPFGESAIIRILEPDTKPKSLDLLGLSGDQEKMLKEFALQSNGLILLVGQTGSGKTTTIYSLINQIDCKTRSLTSIEDPVEYTIPDANQQQVNEKAGITFEKLLKSIMRQDPDILFLGEVRDPYSAAMAMEAASTGHLTITSLHTTNATTAILRLEMLGISRKQMADALLGITAQKLIKTLCPQCKKVEAITREEHEKLAAVTHEVPSLVAHPAGCPHCNNTGYLGREGVYEVIRCDHQVSQMIRAGEPISRIREFVRKRGDFLISDHALQKVREMKISVADAYENVLLEELSAAPAAATAIAESFGRAAISTQTQNEGNGFLGEAPGRIPPPSADGKRHLLVVEDDTDTRAYVMKILENHGFRVSAAGDGVDALLQMGKVHFDLIVSDIAMPTMDGLKLLEILNQKGINTPVVLLTAAESREIENKALRAGACDYVRKPFDKDTLLLRIEKALK